MVLGREGRSTQCTLPRCKCARWKKKLQSGEETTCEGREMMPWKQSWIVQECGEKAVKVGLRWIRQGLDLRGAGGEEQSPGLTCRLKVKSDLSGQETQLKMPNITNPRSRPDDTAPKYHSENAFIL